MIEFAELYLLFGVGVVIIAALCIYNKLGKAKQ